MLDQNFSAKNFMNVYTLENRMGKIPVETMSNNFRAVVDMIKKANSELQTLKNKKKKDKCIIWYSWSSVFCRHEPNNCFYG